MAEYGEPWHCSKVMRDNGPVEEFTNVAVDAEPRLLGRRDARPQVRPETAEADGVLHELLAGRLPGPCGQREPVGVRVLRQGHSRALGGEVPSPCPGGSNARRPGDT